MNKSCIVVTTINEHNHILEKLSSITDLIVVGDLKTKGNYKNCIYLSVDKQNELYPEISELVSYNHYSRKIFGYLYAIENNYDFIYDTDDDNLPLFDEFVLPEFNKEIYCDEMLINIYNHYSDKFIWSRGFPLNRIHNKQNIIEISADTKNPDLIYGLCDGDTDLDAVCRMVTNDENLKFIGSPVYLNNKNMIVFNSQSTFWCNKNYFSFLYLPTTISSRFSDILRSYVMQFCSDAVIGIQPSVAFQKRNFHNLVNDLKDEIFMYENIENVIDLGNKFSNFSIFDFYQKLYENNIVYEKELVILKFWLSFLKKHKI